jgi:hypothetical protein
MIGPILPLGDMKFTGLRQHALGLVVINEKLAGIPRKVKLE